MSTVTLSRSTLIAALASTLVATGAATGATISFQDGSQYQGLVGGTQSSVTLTPEANIKVVVTATSNSNGAPDLNESGGGGQSGAGIQSSGANSSNNGGTIELEGGNQTLDETLSLTFFDAGDNAIAVDLLTFDASVFTTGETLNAVVGTSGTQGFSSSTGSNGAATYSFAASTTLAAGEALSFKATNGDFRVAGLNFEVNTDPIPEPASAALLGIGALFVAPRRRRRA